MDNEQITWTNAKRKLSDLIPWSRNPRQIKVEQIERLQESLTEFGQPEAIAIGPGNEVYNGHQRLKSWADKFGDIEVDVRIANRELTEKEREKLTIFLHKGAAGEWDFDTLANEFDVDDLLDWGFEEHELDLDLWLPEPPDDPGTQIDRAEELREKWGVNTSDLWILGDHRLICGDCTDAEVVARVMDGEKARLMVTDPPYGVDYHGNFIHSGKILEDDERIWQEGIENDEKEFIEVIEESFQIINPILDGGAVCIICAPPGHKLFDFVNLWPDDWHFQAALVWNKQSLIISRWDYHPQHEMLLFGWKRGAKHCWEGGTKQSTVWDIPRHQGSGYEHPTEKPIEIYERAIENHTLKDSVVIDQFSGSGTGIIACERLNRKARAIEISPAYCAVAIQRWVDMTGGEPELVNI